MNQLELFGTPRHTSPRPAPVVPFIPASKTSTAAGAEIQTRAKTLRDKVFLFIKSRREFGATDHEISEVLELPIDTARPRRVELRDTGMICDSGRTRPTRSGRLATVWTISQEIAVYE